MSRHEVSAETTISAPPETVYGIIDDPKQIKELLPHVTSAKAHGSKKGVGSERTVAMKLHGMEITSHQKITVHEPPKVFAWVHVHDTLDGKPFELLEDVGTTFTLSKSGKGTKVVCAAYFTPKGIKAKLMVPLVTRDVKEQLREALSNLKRMAESKAKA